VPSRTLEEGEPVYSPRRLVAQLPVRTFGGETRGRPGPSATMCTFDHAGASVRRIHSPKRASGAVGGDIAASPSGETRYSNREPEYSPNCPPVMTCPTGSAAVPTDPIYCPFTTRITTCSVSPSDQRKRNTTAMSSTRVAATSRRVRHQPAEYSRIDAATVATPNVQNSKRSRHRAVRSADTSSRTLPRTTPRLCARGEPRWPGRFGGWFAVGRERVSMDSQTKALSAGDEPLCYLS